MAAVQGLLVNMVLQFELHNLGMVLIQRPVLQPHEHRLLNERYQVLAKVGVRMENLVQIRVLMLIMTVIVLHLPGLEVVEEIRKGSRDSLLLLVELTSSVVSLVAVAATLV